MPLTNEDLALSLPEKLKLLKGIDHWQEKRKARLRSVFKMRGQFPQAARVLIINEIKLIREQEQRRFVLWRSIINNQNHL